MAAHHRGINVWQWNCRGLHRKKNVLQQFIRSHPEKPHVILLQETLTDTVTLPGYKSHTRYEDGKRGISTLVTNKYTFIVHDLNLESNKVEHSLVEIIPSGQFKTSVFILNIYSTPKDLRQRFAAIINRAVSKAKTFPLLVAGDFNAPHQAWGYTQANRKGVDLWQATVNNNLTLITDPAFPTRIGNSYSRPTEDSELPPCFFRHRQLPLIRFNSHKQHTAHSSNFISALRNMAPWLFEGKISPLYAGSKMAALPQWKAVLRNAMTPPDARFPT